MSRKPMPHLAWMIKHNISVIMRDLVVNRVAGSVVMPYPLRWLVYRAYGIECHTLNIKAECWFTGSDVRIGRGSFVNNRVTFDNLARIEIGEDCRIAMEVMFCTSTHETGGPSRRAGKAIGRPIRVGNGCWIGTRAVILPGVTVGDGCIIAAGAVVTKDCEPHGVFAGVPARHLKELQERVLEPAPGVQPTLSVAD